MKKLLLLALVGLVAVASAAADKNITVDPQGTWCEWGHAGTWTTQWVKGTDPVAVVMKEGDYLYKDANRDRTVLKYADVEEGGTYKVSC